MEINNVINLISNVGFPIFVAFYLLHRFEGKIDELGNKLESLAKVIGKISYDEKLKK